MYKIQSRKLYIMLKKIYAKYRSYWDLSRYSIFDWLKIIINFSYICLYKADCWFLITRSSFISHLCSSDILTEYSFLNFSRKHSCSLSGLGVYFSRDFACDSFHKHLVSVEDTVSRSFTSILKKNLFSISHEKIIKVYLSVNVLFARF